ncbi:MAG: hypothetical protein P4L92_18990 [Rudaea sp.]|nr:hypothetical protein [Rudaea sp.]
MRLSLVLCASVAACGFAPLAGADTNPPLSFTLDLLGPCTQSGCTGNHPTDIGLSVTASSFSYTPGSANSYVATMAVNTPVVCDEIASTGTLGATSALRLGPAFTNSAPGGLLEFSAGSPSIVDLSAMLYDGSLPGVAASYSNSGGTTPQVVCYQINPISGGEVALAPGPTGIFVNGFEAQGKHFANEPWLSVQTVFSPQTTASKSLTTASQKALPNSRINGITPNNTVGYVVQVHNAAMAVGWHLDLGYDFAFFDPANGGTQPQWCILGAGVPQPGPLNGVAACGAVGSSYTLSSGDIQPGSSSVFIYVQSAASVAASSSWSSLTSAIYPAVAAIFPPFGTYPQRFDDKVAVASANNPPVLNVGSIVCNNDTVSTACVIKDQDGNAVPAALTFVNSISGSGVVSVDPLAYMVDPAGGTTLPGNTAADALNVSNVSCSDPSGILAGSLGSGNFTTSSGAQGAFALGFSFTPSGAQYVAGTATCTATFSTTGFALGLSNTQSFTITMLPATASHFAVSAPTSATAGAAISNITVTALDASNNTLGSYSGTVHFTSTDSAGATVLPANATLTNGVGSFSATLTTVGNQTITATDTTTPSVTGTSNPIAVSAGAATHFTVIAPGSATIGTPFSIAVTALDQFNNTATGYAGTVHFTSTDAAAVLPADATLTFGLGIFPTVTLNTAGSQTVTATDTVTATTTGTSSQITVN